MTMPFTKSIFLSIAERMKLPPVFFRVLFTGTPQSIPSRSEDNEEGFVFRTPKSVKENWTLGLSWNESFGDLKAFLYGLQSDETEALGTHLRDNQSQLYHPMNLPIILCEMLTDGDSNGIKAHASMLYDVEFKTKTALNTESLDAKGPDFGEMTRSLNTIISRLAFHDMRIKANRGFVERIELQMKSMSSRLGDKKISISEELRSSLKAATQLMWQRLVHLKTEHQALGLEIALNQRIAQSQLEIVYNLVAQRDNRDNRSLAEISTEIAITTKDDSFAMRTLAIMSIAFLPGTFVASFFSMSMFNWQAPAGTSVVSSRFYIYWAVTGPLTLVVFLIWLFWYEVHKKHDTYAAKLRARTQKQSMSRPSREEKFWDVGRLWPSKRWTHFNAKDEEKQAVEVIEEQHPSNVSTASFTVETVLRQRAPTTQVTRADTIPQGPLR
ncbi:hypothetical protein BU23DRAFT_147202 [Bimuria novae-zelandiae CBS 107.79]|uniref:Uncharacterized protein n=1 Tax=Bimuria novae-zelandiae CBS 107.79 TaxID=1447943 RepID=A0A6A5V6A2_9PLEO|nr:hypothetical protein BU23DRAFT_147202 [Bimuria novae-zelandiae CBS 107.79]